MTDPLSIATGIITILGTTLKVGLELRKLCDEVATIEGVLSAIIHDVDSLQLVLEAMNETLSKVGNIDPLHATGHSGNHWRNINRSLQDADSTLSELLVLLQEVSKTTAFLDTPRKTFRYRAMSDKIERYRSQISSYKDTLQMSLQTMVFWEQLSIRQSTDILTINMAELEEVIRRMARDITKQIQRLESSQTNVGETVPTAEIMVLANLRECVRSSADIISTASTILSSRRSVACDSTFGDCFPRNTDNVAQWIARAPTIYEEISAAIMAPPSISFSELQFGQVRENEGDSDSDSDLEGELARALEKRGREQLLRNEYDNAERSLSNCLGQLTRSRKGNADQVHGVRELFVQALIKQEKWLEAGAEIQKRLASHKSKAIRSIDDKELIDLHLLVDIFTKAGKFSEAQLYGRKLLNTYRKMGYSGYGGVESTLRSLVDICRADDNSLQAEAYASMLDVFIEESAQAPNPIISPPDSGASACDPPSLVFDRSGICSPALEQPRTPLDVQADTVTTVDLPSSDQRLSNQHVTVVLDTSEDAETWSNMTKAEIGFAYFQEAEVTKSTNLSTRIRRNSDAIDMLPEPAKLETEIVPSQLPDKSVEALVDSEESKQTIASHQSTNRFMGTLAETVFAEELDATELKPQIARLRPKSYAGTRPKAMWLGDHIDQDQPPSEGSQTPTNLSPKVENLRAMVEAIREANGMPIDHPITTNNKESGLKVYRATRTSYKRPSGKAPRAVHTVAPVEVSSISLGGPVATNGDESDLVMTRIAKEKVPSEIFSDTRSMLDTGSGHQSTIEGMPRRKIILVGDSQAGKTRLLKRYAKKDKHGARISKSCEGFLRTYETTTKLDDAIFKVTIFDTNGQEHHPRAEDSRRAAYMDAHLIILCFSITVDYALDNIKVLWLKELQEHVLSHRSIPIVLVGTMSDARNHADDARFANSDNKLVDFDAAQSFANEIGALRYMETSAKTGDGVTELFEYAASQANYNALTHRRSRSLSSLMSRSMVQLRRYALGHT